MENPSLGELLEIAVEILEHITVPEGSVLGFGSASHLSRVGTSLYANGWTKLVRAASTRWRSVRICPLIPLIIDDCPGSTAREITELCVWLSTIYENNPLGLGGVWAAVAAAVDDHSVGVALLPSPDTYRIPLPSGLESTSLDSVSTFCSRNSRPVTLRGIPKDKQNELLWSLLETLYRDFHVGDNPEKYLLREPVSGGVETGPGPQKVVSNLGQSCNFFSESGLETINLTVPGWVASPEKIAVACEKVTGLLNGNPKGESPMFVMDLFGNSTFRYEQFDGSISLPFKSRGKYDLEGNIVVSTPQQFKKIAEQIVPICTASQKRCPLCLGSPASSVSLFAMLRCKKPLPQPE